MLTSSQFVDFCRKAYDAGWVYWYGTYGVPCTQSLYDYKKKQYPEHYTPSRAAGYMKDISSHKYCSDCVGLIKAFFWSGGQFEANPKYGSNHCPDVSANGMLNVCTQTGDIRTIPDIPGLVVWKTGHIGVYIGGGYTIEMRGFDYDCVKRKVTDGPWTKWGKLPASMLDYSDSPAGDEPAHDVDIGTRTLRNGDYGADVKQLQENLIRLGYSCGVWGADGDFGDATEMAVEKFQKDNGLEADGVFGPKSRGEMERLLEKMDEPVEKPWYVKIVNGSCWVRSAPNTSAEKLGVVTEGTMLPYQGQTSDNGWHLVIYNNQNGWVSGKYSGLVPPALQEERIVKTPSMPK